MAERYDRTLWKKFDVCSLQLISLVHFWGEALQIAVQIPTQYTKGDILEEIWFGKWALYDHVHIFGCEALV